MATPAAAQTLVAGDNSLTTQIHLDPSKDDTALTVYGLTKPGDVSISFSSDTELHATGGAGYAQISDNTPLDGNGLDNLLIALTLGGGFTDYEFTIQYASDMVSKALPAYLRIDYTLVGGGGGFFNYLTGGCAACANLVFENSAATDFRLNAGAGNAFASLLLTSNYAFEQVKQNDITLAVAPVPEPSTWAMMLLGFGAVGFSIRRSRKGAGVLRAIA